MRTWSADDLQTASTDILSVLILVIRQETTWPVQKRKFLKKKPISWVGATGEVTVVNIFSSRKIILAMSVITSLGYHLATNAGDYFWLWDNLEQPKLLWRLGELLYNITAILPRAPHPRGHQGAISKKAAHGFESVQIKCRGNDTTIFNHAIRWLGTDFPEKDSSLEWLCPLTHRRKWAWPLTTSRCRKVWFKPVNNVAWSSCPPSSNEYKSWC